MGFVSLGGLASSPDPQLGSVAEGLGTRLGGLGYDAYESRVIWSL